MSRVLSWGLGLTGLVTAILVLVWGRAALVPGIGFGLLATAIQVVAARLVRPALAGSGAQLVKRWAHGMGLRLGGVVVFGLAATFYAEVFPPLPTALGFLGVLVPLLFMEIRLFR